MTKKSKAICGLVDQTIADYYKIFDGKISDKRTGIIIFAIIGDMPYNSETREILDYCKSRFNFDIPSHL